MINTLFSDPQMPQLVDTIRFTQARMNVLAEDVANLNTPDYRPKDLSLGQFQQLLRDQSAGRVSATSTQDVLSPKDANANILFHDRNNRSVEQLMADQASNALLHNTMVELLRKQFSQLQDALKDHVG